MTTSETDGSFKSSKLVQIPYVNDNSKEKRINLVFYAALKLISQTLVIGIKVAVHPSSPLQNTSHAGFSKRSLSISRTKC